MIASELQYLFVVIIFFTFNAYSYHIRSGRKFYAITIL